MSGAHAYPRDDARSARSRSRAIDRR